MPTVSWLSGTDGDWSVGGSWSGGAAPNDPATDVVISVAPGAGSFSYTVGIGSTEDFTAGALLLNNDGAFLNVAGTLDAAGAVTVQAGDLEMTGGTVIAAGVTLSADGNLDGNGTITGAGTLSDAGLINSNAGTLVLAPGVLSVADGGILEALGNVLTLSPTGGLSNFAGGTLTTGVYQVGSGGIIDLPNGDAVTVDAASIVLNDGGSITAPSANSLIQAFDTGTSAFQPLQASLTTIAATGALSVESGYDYVTGNSVSVAGTLALAQGIFTAGNLDVVASGQLIGHGLVTTAIHNDGTITAVPDPTFFLQPGSADTLLTIGGPITGAGELSIVPSGTLELGAAAAQDVTFSTFGNAPGRAATLVLDQPITYSGTIVGFQGAPIVLGAPQPSDAIDLVGVGTAGLGKNYIGDGSGGTLVLTEGTTTVELNFSGSYTTNAFALSPDGGTGTRITLACFVVGTRIATPAGEVAVEALAVGDTVLTLAHGGLAVRWIGRRRIDCRRHRDPAQVWPVRIRAGAFAADRPRRDLLLSPDHAVFVDDVLIPVRYLINGASIRQERWDQVSYLHVELPRHAVLLAEGLPAESYLDAGDRANFANGGGAIGLHPDFSARAWDAEGCAPLVVTGPKLDAVREWLGMAAGDVEPGFAEDFRRG